MASLRPLSDAGRRLLVQCARMPRAGDGICDIAVRIPPSDWPATVQHARLHSVGPLLRHALLEAGCLDALPEQARHQLLALQHRTDFQNRHMALAQALVVDALRKAGVPALVPKGLNLAELCYGGLALRPLLDLVFLVPASRFDHSQDVMQRLGYAAAPRSLADAVYRWSCPGRMWWRPGAVTMAVYLFTDLVNWPRWHRLDGAGLWSRASETVVCGSVVHALSTEDQVLYLALQIDNNGFFNGALRRTLTAEQLLFAPWSNNRVIRFADLRNYLVQPGSRIDWGVLVRCARDANLAQPVRVSLDLVRELYGPAAPAEAVQALAVASRPASFGRRCLAAAAAPEVGAPSLVRSAATPLRIMWTRLPAARQSELVRMVGLCEMAFPPPDALRTSWRPTFAARWAHALRIGARSIGALMSEARGRMARAAISPERGRGARGTEWRGATDNGEVVTR